jgi:hypothetical protein
MIDPKCEVVRFIAQDGYVYTGLLFRALQASDNTVIHIHGMCGNMLSFSSLLHLAECYTVKGYNLLTFNLKAHDCIAEGHWINNPQEDDFFFYVGGSLEPFERCVIDIKSAISFVSTFSNNIILQGHSMGCERIITYQIATQNFYNTILLSPCDAYQLQMDYIYPETIEEQLVELKKYDNSALLPPKFFGINSSKGERYTIPIYKKAMESILTGYALKVFRQDKDLDYFIPINCLCLLGKNDPLQTYEPQKAFSILKKKFSRFEGHALMGDHEMKPVEDEMVIKISNWLDTIYR